MNTLHWGIELWLNLLLQVVFAELLAIDENDLFFDTNEVRIDESLQYTKKKGYRFKDPKSNSFRKVTMPPDSNLP